MILSAPEIRSSLDLATAAFPRFSDWEHDNEVNESYSGFALWGEIAADPDESVPRSFFVTFDTYEASWRGHLTIGKPCYYWSSADFGDAELVDTGPCTSLGDAIASLKGEMRNLLAVLAGSPGGPGADFGADS